VVGLSEGNVRFSPTCQSTVSAVAELWSMTRASGLHREFGRFPGCFQPFLAHQSGGL